MILKKNAIINNFYISYDTATNHNVYLVKLIKITMNSNPVLFKLIKIRPDFSVMSSSFLLPDFYLQWEDLYHLNHKTVKDDIRVLSKHPGNLFNVIFKEGD